VLPLTWTRAFSSPVRAFLRSRVPEEHVSLTKEIIASILNYGTFTYTPAAANSIPGTPYTVEIVSDANPSMINFTPQFVINGASAAAPPATAGAYAVESMATAAASSVSAAPLAFFK